LARMAAGVSTKIPRPSVAPEAARSTLQQRMVARRCESVQWRNGGAFCETVDDNGRPITIYIEVELASVVADGGINVGDRLLCQNLPGFQGRRMAVNLVPLGGCGDRRQSQNCNLRVGAAIVVSGKIHDIGIGTGGSGPGSCIHRY